MRGSEKKEFTSSSRRLEPAPVNINRAGGHHDLVAWQLDGVSDAGDLAVSGSTRDAARESRDR